MPRAAILALVPLLLALTPAQAQDGGHAKATLSVAGEAAPGGTVEVRARVEVEPAWHVYAVDTPNGQATTLELSLPPGVTAEGALREDPAPHGEEIEYVGKVSIHRGVVTFSRTLRLGPDAKLPLSIPAKVVWQACDDANTQCVTGEAASVLQVGGGGDVAPVESGGLALGEGLSSAPVEPRVEVTVSLAPAPGGGQRADLVIELAIEQGWHIYATHSPEGLPTSLSLTLPPGVQKAGPLQEPAARTEHIEGFGEVHIYGGVVRLVQPLEIAAEALASPIQGVVAWQVCDDENSKGCYQDERGFTASLAGEVKTLPAPPAAATPPAAADADLLSLAAASIGLGLLMLLQPCTYPMIPITVSIFSKGKALTRRAAVLRAGTYALGIVLSFVLVGAVIQVAFGAAGQGRLNELATNPFVNLAIGLIFVYFAFSFFGYYELGLPAPLQRLMQLGQAKRESDGTVPVWSLFLMGFFFVLTSYTCGAPIVLALFANAAQDPHPGAVVFATGVFATTVALPFFVLSLVPGAVRSLPRSGSWFSVFKATLGFLELAFALKFLRGADVIWHVGLLERPVFLGIWTALSFATALYLLGWFPLRFPHDPEDLRARSFPRLFWAGLFALLGVYFGAGAAGRPLVEELEAFILSEHEGGENEVMFGPLAYRTDRAALDAGLKRSKKDGKPVLLIFTGHNCVNCVLMENKVLPRPDVVAKLQDIPRVALFTDRGDEEKKNLALMEEKYRTTVLPSFYLLDGDGKVLAAQNGGSSAEAFLAFLAKGGL